MRDVDETKVRQELFELVRDLDVAPDLERRTIKRARRQRALNATLSLVVAVGLVAGIALGASSVLPADRSQPGGQDESPTPPGIGDIPPFQGIWPESDAAALANAQAQIDDGHQPWRTEPAFTAAVLTVELFGWAPDSAETEVVRRDGSGVTVEVRNPEFAQHVQPIVVELAQLGRTGPNGIWSVTAVSSDLIQLEVMPGTSIEGTHVFAGTLTDVYDGSSLRFEVLGGSPDAPAGTVGLDGSAFQFEIPARVGGFLWVQVVDATGRALGATAVRLPATTTDVPTPTPSSSVSDPSPVAPPPVDVTGVPPATAETARRIYDAVLDTDLATLASLLDPMTFVYNLDDGSNPIPEWRSDPTVLDPIAVVLLLPPAEPRNIKGYGTFYIWPYLVDSDLSNLTDRGYSDLLSLGFTRREVDAMIEYGSYLGPRLAIDENGLWRNYVTGGD